MARLGRTVVHGAGGGIHGRVSTLVDVAPAEAARAMVRAFVRYSAAYPAVNRLMMQECTSDSWRVDCIVEEHIRPMLESLYEVLPEASALLWGDRDPHRYYLFIGRELLSSAPNRSASDCLPPTPAGTHSWSATQTWWPTC